MSRKEMKFRRCTIDHCEIQQIMNMGHFEKLAELRDDNSTLQVELPNIFTNQNFRKSTQPTSHINYSTHEQQMDTNLIRSRNKKKAICVGEDESRHKRNGQTSISYYMLIKMLFPEGPGIPALSIDVMDTIFYNSDNSMTYVYTDPKRGLIKTKSKNYIQLFLKRKAEIDSAVQTYLPLRMDRRQTISSQDPIFSSFQARDQFLKNFDYVALLRYKDEHFFRLKQHQFKSIFIRPVQANQKYKIWNNTQYIQLIPEQVNYREGTILNVEFCLNKHKDTSFFLKAVQKHSEETASRSDKESKTIKDQIKKINTSAYLLYVVFEIYAYVHLHYQKQISSGVFQFMKVKDEYYLSNVRNIKISESDSIRNQYARADLFEDFVTLNQGKIEADNQIGNGVISALEELFDRQNVKICDKVKAIIQKKISDVEDRQDANDSNQIFKSINGQCEQSLHSLFQNQHEYEKFLLKKQIEIDGGSPLVSISNIKRKKLNRADLNSNFSKSRQIQSKQKLKQNIFFERNIFLRYSATNKRPGTAKWYKKTMNGRKQYLMQPKRQ